MWTKIIFEVSLEKLELVDDDIKNKLKEYCSYLMPANAGFDIMQVDFTPIITFNGKTADAKSLTEELENITGDISGQVIAEILPDDIKQKGKFMTEVYLFLYCVENSLRLFIESVAKKNLGDDYFDKLKLNTQNKQTISIRKDNESKNKWLRLRGDSEIFYLDFQDLGKVIQNNWDIFGSYFPDQGWIITKINELAECRNLVAHNSVVGEHEKDVIKTHYRSILRQLNEVLKTSP